MDKITYAYLETTNYCNLDCSFCNRSDVIGPLKHMSLENWGKLLDGIKHHPKNANANDRADPEDDHVQAIYFLTYSSHTWRHIERAYFAARGHSGSA